MRGPAGYLEIIGMMRGGFPDIQWTLEKMIAEEEKVAARFTMRGTHRGTFFGAAPTVRRSSGRRSIFIGWRVVDSSRSVASLTYSESFNRSVPFRRDPQG
jgi:hypothetical protein